MPSHHNTTASLSTIKLIDVSSSTPRPMSPRSPACSHRNLEMTGLARKGTVHSHRAHPHHHHHHHGDPHPLSLHLDVLGLSKNAKQEEEEVKMSCNHYSLSSSSNTSSSCCCSMEPNRRAKLHSQPSCSISTSLTCSNREECCHVHCGHASLPSSSYEDDALQDGGGQGFVSSERCLMRNLLLLSLASSVALGVVYTLLSLDRYFYGPWTFLALSATFLVGALSVYYAQACVTRYGPNRILAISVLSVVLFVLVHFSSNFILFQLGVLLLALCLGPFYAAQLNFLSHLTSRLVYLTPTVKRHQEERYQRLFHLIIFCPSHIVGHLLFVVLFFLNRQLESNESESSSPPPPPLYGLSVLHQHYLQQHHVVNASSHQHRMAPTAHQSRYPTLLVCSQIFERQYCDQALYYIFSFNRYQYDLGMLRPLTSSFVTFLTSSFLVVSLLALGVILFLLQRTHFLQIQDPIERSFLSTSIRNVLFRTLHDQHLRLLLPMAFFVGLEQGFFVADFNKLYVSCSLGLDAIGMVMLTRGVVHLGATLLVHEFVRHIARPVILLSGAICQLGTLAILCLWRPNDDVPLYYVIATCWALSNAIWETLLLTNILRTFSPEEWNYALLTLHSFSLLGLGASFGVSEFVCLYVKLYALIGSLLVALIPMKICEFRLIRLEKILGPGSASHV